MTLGLLTDTLDWVGHLNRILFIDGEPYILCPRHIRFWGSRSLEPETTSFSLKDL